MNLSAGGVVEQLIVADIETIAKTFQEEFNQCVGNVLKPNVLVTGVTGSGKSSLINAVFGATVTEVGDGIPVTKHFSKIEPHDKPVVVYDSKGLEHGYHEEFISETKTFFESTRANFKLQDQIHVIWYVINAAAGRFEPFELQLVREVFHPTPMIFLLNKSDVASAQQLFELERCIMSYQIPNCKGIFRIVADRKNYSQNWCPSCGGDDVTFKRSTNELFCDGCNCISIIKPRLNLTSLIDATSELLPDLTKEAFLFSQVESLHEKDKHARELVFRYATNICMDVSGKALKEVGEMVGKLFVLWGWNFLGLKVSSALIKDMKEEYKNQDLSVRLAMIAADTIMKRKLSRSVIACLGVLANKPLRTLTEKLLTMIEQNMEMNIQNFDLSTVTNSDEFAENFMRVAMESGIAAAIDQFWYES